MVVSIRERYETANWRDGVDVHKVKANAHSLEIEAQRL